VLGLLRVKSRWDAFNPSRGLWTTCGETHDRSEGCES
jgi:hypothetical protein